MRALITGVSGFAGSYLAEYCLARGDVDVTGLVRNSARPGNAASMAGQMRFVQGDLRDGTSIDRAVQEARPEVIFHLGGQAFVPRSFTDPEGTLLDNAIGLVHVIQAILRHRPQARLLVVASSSVYGLVRSEENPVHEDVPLRPVDPYGVSKATQDLLAYQYGVSHALQAVRVRPFNHTGPRQSDLFAPSGFARQVAEIEAGLKTPVLPVGNLAAVRDLSDVRDVVQAYFLAATQGRPGAVYNIGSGTGRPMSAVVEGLRRLSRVPFTVREEAERFRPLDVPVLVCDARRLTDQTGWRPKIPFEQTLTDLLEAWRRHTAASSGLQPQRA
jgi:GDP-4-dehydro-6-deoxy-D-mannose reductase